MASKEYAVQYKNCAGWFIDSIYTAFREAKKRAMEIGADYTPTFDRIDVRIQSREVSNWKTTSWRIKDGK